MATNYNPRRYRTKSNYGKPAFNAQDNWYDRMRKAQAEAEVWQKVAREAIIAELLIRDGEHPSDMVVDESLRERFRAIQSGGDA